MPQLTHVRPEASSAATGAHEKFNFHDELLAVMPKLRVQALALTRNRADADDLVQTAVINALSHQDSFTPGTNFQAWTYRILRNRFLSDRRAMRELITIEDAPHAEISRPAGQEDSLSVSELQRHMARLPADQRSALVMVAIEGMSYEEVAEAMDCPEGTAKARVFRARKQLEVWLLGREESRRSAPRRPAASARNRTQRDDDDDTELVEASV